VVFYPIDNGVPLASRDLGFIHPLEHFRSVLLTDSVQVLLAPAAQESLTEALLHDTRLLVGIRRYLDHAPLFRSLEVERLVGRLVEELRK
jgi:hypothetical protein